LKKSLKAKWVVPVAALVLTVSAGSAAFAASGSSTAVADPATSTAITQSTAADAATAAGATTATAAEKQRSDETLLTGDALAKVQAAAVANVGSDATVLRVETDADGNAKYEVHMTLADGSEATVYVDESYNVVSVETGGKGGDKDGGGQRSDETLLTGDALAKVQAAAVAKEPGATVVRVETDGDGNAKYEVHMTLADGSKATVYVDESYNVVSVATGDQAGGGHHKGDSDSDDGTSSSTDAGADDQAETTSTSGA
jgi:uncharacterized membrane protein YkoI